MKGFPPLMKNFITLLLLFMIFPLAGNAQDAVSNPIGVVRTSIAPSKDGITAVATLWAPTLFQQAQLQGAMFGKITSVSGSTISVNNAKWKSNQLIGTYFYIQSGPLTGGVINIVSNTDKSLTLNSESLAVFGNRLAANNNFQIIQGDTLLSILGTPTDGVVGGTFADFENNKTDRVMIRDESAKFLQTYYYDTTIKHWRDAVSPQIRDSLTISPLSGAIYYRIGKSAMELTFTGNVPINGGRFIIPEGISCHARFFPVSTTLNSLEIQALTGWKRSNTVSESLADRIMIQGTDGIYRIYWHNGVNWVTNGTTANQNNTSIKEGSAFFTIRAAVNAPAVYSMPQPY
jgi:hypothetical protein